MAVRGDAFDVLVAVREKLLQDALRARIDAVANDGNVARGVAGVLEILVWNRVVDVPVFLDPAGLIFLVLERLLARRVELQRLLVCLRGELLGPVFLLVALACYRIGRGVRVNDGRWVALPVFFFDTAII